MREFKFRAWERVSNYCSEKKMYYFDFIDVHSDGYSDVPYHWEFKDSHIMQYVGLRDKNGKEVYEGDILEGLGVVEYLENEARFCINIFGELHEVTFTELLTEELIVLGNIYENPKLLEEIKKELGR